MEDICRPLFCVLLGLYFLSVWEYTHHIHDGGYLWRRRGRGVELEIDVTGYCDVCECEKTLVFNSSRWEYKCLFHEDLISSCTFFFKRLRRAKQENIFYRQYLILMHLNLSYIYTYTLNFRLK